MSKIVWEEKWHTEGWPDLGDYIQLRHHDEDRVDDTRVSEGTVIRIDAGGEWLYLWPEVPDDHGRVAEAWRRGALPEQQSVVRRETTDA